MRCDELTGLLDLYVDGDLPEEMRRKLDRHTLRCAKCAHEVLALEQTRSMLREAVPAQETSPAFRERVQARLLDAFAVHLRAGATDADARQWTLPFPLEDASSSM